MLDDTHLTGGRFCRAYAGLVDGWLAELLGGEDDVALVALGGYGRAELCPGSDIDVLLLHAGRKGVRELAERIWYPLWDVGLKLGHSVRTVKEAVTLAAADLETATSLLTCRLLAGDARLASDLSERALGLWRKRSGKWLADLARSVADRHEKAGEVAFLLEPDLKEGRGGLRDVHALAWAEAGTRILLPGDHESLQGAYETLLAVRVELHRRTGKTADRLTLQEQDGIAAALGDADADALMARVSAAARTIAFTSDEAWERITSSLRGPLGRIAARDRPAGRGVVVRDGVVELTSDADPATDPALVLRAAAAAAEAGTRLGRAALDRLTERTPPPADPWPDDLRRHLVALLAAGRPAIPVLEALDQRGLLSRLLPEWEAVRSLPQRNAWHRFTVDRHLCEAAAEAAALTGAVERPDLLLVGAWLHDIGKGYPGDHTEAGMEVVRRVAARMGFPADDVEVLVTLVRHHLLLPDTATRRDLQDAATIATVAEAVGDRATLNLLAALTEADAVATGPAAWGSWRRGLVRDLVARTTRVLAGDGHETRSELPADQAALLEQAQRAGEVTVRAEGGTVTVVAPDRPGLFCRVAGTLSLHGLDVLAARALSAESGWAVETFRVESAFGTEPNWDAFEDDLRRVLSGKVSLEARLARRARTYERRPRPAAASPAQTRVAVDNEASATATVVEVRAPDRMGTLYRITRALADLDLDVRHAKVDTLGHEVVDAFYVVDATGAKIGDAEHAHEIEQAVLVELSRT